MDASVSLLLVCTVVEPPELLHLSYVVDQPKVAEVLQEAPEETGASKDDDKSEGRSSLLKSKSKVEAADVSGEEVKQTETVKQETMKERKDVERPPIFVTMQ